MSSENFENYKILEQINLHIQNKNWLVSQEVADKYLSKLKDFIKECEELNDYKEKELKFENDINPWQIWKMLNFLGWDEEYIDNNGWELDAWIEFRTPQYPKLVLELQIEGIIFKVKLLARYEEVRIRG